MVCDGDGVGLGCGVDHLVVDLRHGCGVMGVIFGFGGVRKWSFWG